jgi:hypothetical protein
MLKTIEFNPDNGTISAEVEMGGILFVSYSLLLYSTNTADAKILQTEHGNNKQTHDDNFNLASHDSVENNNGRYVLLSTTLLTEENSTPYEISLIFKQQGLELGRVSKSGSANSDDNGRGPAMGALLNSNDTES